uniref:Gamma-interferon-inducible lysosomal thiol reductase n=1 Tax=Tetraodon nigroviridis TaxID=99883 RepID=H3CXW0_TETNG
MKLWLLLVLSLLRAAGSPASRPKPACRYPPSQWCRSLEIALECRVQKQCMELAATRPQRPPPPVAVAVYYQSLCPGSRLFISRQLFPTWSLLQDIMAVTLVPYGHAQVRTPPQGQPNPQNPPADAAECVANTLQACLVHLSGPWALQIVSCMESSADPLAAARPCLQLFSPSVSWSALDACVKGGLGRRLMLANAAMTRALSPAHTHLPWVTLPTEHTEELEVKGHQSL